MRNAQSEALTPSMSLQIYEIVSNNEYYNEQGTHDNTDGDCWTTYQSPLPLLVEKTVYVWEFVWIFEAQSSHHGPLLHPHIDHWLDMACLRGHWLVYTTDFRSAVFIQLCRPYIYSLSSSVSDKSFMTYYKINIFMVPWWLFCTSGWCHIKVFKRNIRL
jgi:hypothetical protein